MQRWVDPLAERTVRGPTLAYHTTYLCTHPVHIGKACADGAMVCLHLEECFS